MPYQMSITLPEATYARLERFAIPRQEPLEAIVAAILPQSPQDVPRPVATATAVPDSVTDLLKQYLRHRIGKTCHSVLFKAINTAFQPAEPEPPALPDVPVKPRDAVKPTLGAQSTRLGRPCRITADACLHHGATPEPPKPDSSSKPIRSQPHPRAQRGNQPGVNHDSAVINQDANPAGCPKCGASSIHIKTERQPDGTIDTVCLSCGRRRTGTRAAAG